MRNGIWTGELVCNSLSNEQLQQELQEIFERIKKVQRSNERIQHELGRRTIQQVLTEGTTCYMGSCVDMTLAFLMQLKEKYPDWNQFSLWCELLRWKASGIDSFHFFIQETTACQPRIIDFEKDNTVALYRGEYKNPRWGTELDQLQLLLFSAEEITKEDSLFSLAQKFKLPFSDSLFQGYLLKLQQDNSVENFEKFTQEHQGLTLYVDGKIVLDPSLYHIQQVAAEELAEELSS